MNMPPRKHRKLLGASVEHVLKHTPEPLVEYMHAALIDAGLLLRCPCGWIVMIDEPHCDNCKLKPNDDCTFGVDCDKCHGEGWVIPIQRRGAKCCFACRGTGRVNKKRRSAK